VDLAGTDISDECITSIIEVERISELGTTLSVTNFLAMGTIRSYETSVLIRPTQRLIPKDDILHNQRHEDVKPYNTMVSLGDKENNFRPRTASSWMLRRVALVRTDVSEELTRATRHNIPEDSILHSHRLENLKSYIVSVHCETMITVQHVTVTLMPNFPSLTKPCRFVWVGEFL
jgi:hypothetical protein